MQGRSTVKFTTNHKLASRSRRQASASNLTTETHRIPTQSPKQKARKQKCQTPRRRMYCLNLSNPGGCHWGILAGSACPGSPGNDAAVGLPRGQHSFGPKQRGFVFHSLQINSLCIYIYTYTQCSYVVYLCV